MVDVGAEWSNNLETLLIDMNGREIEAANQSNSDELVWKANSGAAERLFAVNSQTENVGTKLGSVLAISTGRVWFVNLVTDI